MKTKQWAALTLAAAMTFSAQAIGDALPEKGPNGGLLRESGDHHIELIVSGQSLTFHLLDHKNKPVAEAGLTGTAVVTAGAATETVMLKDAGGGKLTGAGKIPATGALRVDVNIKAPNEPALTATFDVKR
ncbi:MAG: hypothetical protein KBA31_18695 [Alphaproteobacteria bacterium]|nr:hypothetical protein [Alphaproteobacteria bacterium]